jgi:hypothetical protein
LNALKNLLGGENYLRHTTQSKRKLRLKFPERIPETKSI